MRRKTRSRRAARASHVVSGAGFPHYVACVRVVAGSARGRKIVAPPGLDVRPTLDRVRQAIFNALDARGAVEGARVIDVFAGSGALGIEALSRGADHVTFVEHDRKSLACIKENLEHLGFMERASIVRSDVVASSGWRIPASTAFGFPSIHGSPKFLRACGRTGNTRSSPTTSRDSRPG